MMTRLLRRFPALLTSLLVCLCLVSPAGSGSMGLLGVGVASAVAPTYTGPGDVNGAALGWWGLRAFNASYASGTGNIADIVDTATGAASCTIKAKTNGDADLTSLLCVGATVSVTTFCTVTHAAGCSISKLYDQSGNGNHVTQATLASMPLLILSSAPGFNASRPAIKDIGLMFGGAITQAQPYTTSMVANRTISGGNAGFVLDDNSNESMGFGSVANSAFFQAVTPTDITGVADASLHAAQFIFNSSTSSAYIDGSLTSSLNPGTSSFSNLPVLGRSTGGTTQYYSEVGIWAGNKSANNSTMNANQHSYWF